MAPCIHMLDGATASIDTHTEQRMQTGLKMLSTRRCRSLIIGDRCSNGTDKP